MSETPNPFMNRGVITDPNDFFGREEQVNEIFTRLQGMQSSSIVGERRIGKSSLLYYLTQTGPQRLGDAYRFFYLDIQDAHFHTAGILANCFEQGRWSDREYQSGQYAQSKSDCLQ